MPDDWVPFYREEKSSDSQRWFYPTPSHVLHNVVEILLVVAAAMIFAVALPCLAIAKGMLWIRDSLHGGRSSIG